MQTQLQTQLQERRSPFSITFLVLLLPLTYHRSFIQGYDLSSLVPGGILERTSWGQVNRTATGQFTLSAKGYTGYVYTSAANQLRKTII